MSAYADIFDQIVCSVRSKSLDAAVAPMNRVVATVVQHPDQARGLVPPRWPVLVERGSGG
jgi:hypothetical protein